MKLEHAIKSSKFKNEIHKAALNILYTGWWLRTIMSRELKEFGLTHEQYNVLRILKGKHPEQMCVRDIACRMIERNSNVPRIIDRLELKKLVRRTASPNDGRETSIIITQAGLHLLEASTARIDKSFEKLILMEETSAIQLNDLLEKIREKED